jgi:hypothetical protein
MGHRVVVVPDDALADFESHKRLSIHGPARGYQRVLVAPHKLENTSNVDLWRVRCHCEKEGIHLIGYGSLLQLPMLSVFADELIVHSKRPCRLYSPNPRRTYYRAPSRLARHRAYLEVLAESSRAVYREVDIAVPIPITDWLREVRAKVSVDEIIQKFTWQTIFVRESTYRIYHEMARDGSLPRDCIWCEAAYFDRSLPANTMAALDLLRQHDFGLPVVGLGSCAVDHYAFQRRLFESVGDHYLGIQVLCSMLSNCFMLCLLGSSNLFAILPTKNIALTDRYLETVVTEEREPASSSRATVPAEILRSVLVARYGPAGEAVILEPWDRPHEGLARMLARLPAMIDAMWRDRPSIMTFDEFIRQQGR